MTTPAPTLFEQRLQENLQDPAFRATFEREMREIARVQELLTHLDAAREEAGLSKADLARLTGTHPAAVRKLLTSGDGNPSLRSFIGMLDATGLELQLVKRRSSRRSTRRAPAARSTTSEAPAASVRQRTLVPTPA